MQVTKPISISLMTIIFSNRNRNNRALHSFPTRRSSDLDLSYRELVRSPARTRTRRRNCAPPPGPHRLQSPPRSEEHTSELQSHVNIVCRLLLEKKKKIPSFLPLCAWCASAVCM